jgi:aspartyl-tRNA(Asn)/glutamyl-tRNA(Gln) amidotransferase subunit B
MGHGSPPADFEHVERVPSPDPAPAGLSDHEAVIGLEIHVQLRTAQKLFCPDATRFGDAPNTNVCPVCLGLPGALPVVNPEAVELAIRAALAFGCTVHERSVWARKHYFYPDLPKGYQISQFEEPLATGGRFAVERGDRAGGPANVSSGGARGPSDEAPASISVRIRRIHLEEDAGKSIHDRFPDATAVDLNRTGTPLVEMVSEPDLRTPAEARAWLTGVKQVLEYLDVSDCNMEEGSLRVDANLSIRPAGARTLGTKTELKNMNSFSGVERALEVEIARQRRVVEAGGAVEHQTLLWDERSGDVRPMRTKEESLDYRYFPDPDLPPLRVEPERIRGVAAALPELPGARRGRFVDAYGLPPYDAGVLTADRALADYFEEAAGALGDPKEASNWVMGPVLAAMKERGEGAEAFPLRPSALAGTVDLVRKGTITRTVARDLLGELLARADAGEAPPDPAAVVEAKGWAQVSDPAELEGWVDEALAAHPDEVARLRGGEKRLQGFFMGEVMKRSRGKADPSEVRRLLEERLGGGGRG